MLEQVKLNHIKIRTTLAGTSGGARATEGSRVIRARATEVRLYKELQKKKNCHIILCFVRQSIVPPRSDIFSGYVS